MMLGFDKRVVAASIIWIGAVIWQETVVHGYVRTPGEILIIAAIFSIFFIRLADALARSSRMASHIKFRKSKRAGNGRDIGAENSRILMLLQVLSEQEKAEVAARLMNQLEPDEFEEEDLVDLLHTDTGVR